MMLLPRDHNLRFLTIVGTMQTVAVIFGTLLVVALMKPILDSHSVSLAELPKGTVFVHKAGLLMLVVPVAWVAAGVFAHCRTHSPVLLRTLQCAGLGLFLGLVFLYWAAVIGPFLY